MKTVGILNSIVFGIILTIIGCRSYYTPKVGDCYKYYSNIHKVVSIGKHSFKTRELGYKVDYFHYFSYNKNVGLIKFDCWEYK